VAGSLDVLVRFIGDSSSISKETEKVKGTGSKISGWAKGVGAAIGGAFAVSKVKDFVTQASSLQDAMAASETIFGKASEGVIAFGAAADEAFGLSQTQAVDAANTFATFGKAAGVSGTDLAVFSNKLVGLSGDLASFRGTSPEDAILAIGAALRGESEPIRAYGVLLDDATLKARAMQMGLVKATGSVTAIKSAQIAAQSAQKNYNDAVAKHGKDSEEASVALQKLELAQARTAKATEGTVPTLTAQQKVLAANAEIFAQTGDAQGDFSRTSDSAANQQKILAAQMENAGTAIGTALLPLVQKIIPYITTMATWIEKNSTLVLVLAGSMVVLAAAVWLAANPILAIGLAVAALIAGIVLLWRNWDQVWAWIMEHKAYAFLIAIFFPIIAQIVATVAAAKWLAANWQTIWNVIQTVVGAAVKAIVAAWNALKSAASATGNFFKSVWNAVASFFGGVGGRIAADARRIAAVFNVIKDAVTAVYNWVRDKFGAIVNVIAGAVSGISSAVGRVVNAIKAPLRGVVRAWNNFRFPTFELPSVEILGRTIGGGSFGGWDLPHLNVPGLDTGGYIARTGLAVVHQGETVIPKGAGGATYNITVNAPVTSDPATVGRAVIDTIRAYERRNGDRWRTA
jgi:hypothetical protein